MQYTIHSKEIDLPQEKRSKPVRGIGIEVIPPLPEGLAENIGSILTRGLEDDYVDGRDHFAKRVDITRNEGGTVFIVEPNFFRSPTPADVAQTIGKLLNPCDLDEHHISYENH